MTTQEIRETVESLRRAIEFAPADPGPIAPNLLGWWTPDRVYICAKCAGRIFARGCSIPRNSIAEWKGQVTITGICVCCCMEETTQQIKGEPCS